MSANVRNKRKAFSRQGSSGNDDSSDDTESNNGIPANDLRHRIGRLVHGSRKNSSKNKKMRVSPYNVEGDEDVRNDRRIVVNKEDDASRKAVKSAVYSPSKGLNSLVSYNSSGDSSGEEGSSRPAVGVRSVVFKRDAEDAEMPSLEDDDEVTSKPKNPKKKKDKSETQERLQHLKKQFTEKKEKDKKGKPMYVPPHRRNQGSPDEHSRSEDSDSGEEGKSTRQLEINRIRKKVDRIDELVRLKKEIVEAESTIMQKDSEIEKLRNRVRPGSEEIVKDDSEMLRQRVKSKSGSSAAASEESKILRIREKSRSKPETNTSSDSEMLCQRTKAQNPSGAEAITTEEEVLRLRRNKSSSSLGKADVVASSDTDILRIRRNASAASLENLDDTDSPRPKTKSGSSKSWADIMDQEESQNKKRQASARTARTKPRGKGVSAVYLIPELEDDDDDSGSTAAGSRSEPRKHKFKFGADESRPSVKQRLNLGGTSSTSKTRRNEWNSGKQNNDGDKTKSRYDMFKEESRKTTAGNFQDEMNEMRQKMGGGKWAKKRTENNIWGKQTPSKGAAAEKDHTDKSLSYQERLDALRSKCSHMYQKPGTSPYDISWKTGNWKAKFQKMYQNLPKVPYIDTHCHIDFLFQRTNFRGTFNEYLDQNSETVPETFAGCVAVFCNPSTYFSEKKLFMDLLKEPNVHAAVGVHPKSAGDYNARIEMQMKRMLDHEKVVALGEIGLDYSGSFYQEAAVQKRVFIRQLQLAEELDLPIVIHCRDAEEDCVEIMEQTIDRHHVIHRHCWTGSWEECEIWLDKFPNSFIGLTPLVTHSSGRALPVREVAARLPLDKLLLETDAPYFIPSCIPKESMKFTHPALAITVASEVAELQDVPVEEVLRHVARNTYKMYGIKPELD